MATAVTQGATGNPYIDGVLSGVKWSGTVTYSFPDSSGDYPAGYGSGEPLNNFVQLSVTQQTAVHFIMQMIGNYTNLTITFAGTDGADIRLAGSDDANPTAYAYYPNNSASGTGGDVWFGDNYNYTNPVLGSYEYITHIHELGHAFGLKHGQELGGPGNVAIPSDRDALEYTVMTYRSYLGGPTTGYTNEQWGYPQTFMMSDIAALQTMYGADYTYRSGDTVYSWTPGSGITYVDGVAWLTPGGNRIFMTIWDGGGIDTYDFSAYTTGVTIDLGPGDYSIGSAAQLAYLGGGNYAHGNVYNAYLFQGDARSYIENAIGGSGNDFIYGNDVANDLRGGGGMDTIYGGLSGDKILGGPGNDTVYGEQGPDVLFGNAGNDTLYGGGGNDFLNGGPGDDIMVGGASNDSYYVDSLSDFVIEVAGEGIDAIAVSISGYVLPVNVEIGVANSVTGLTLTGNSLDNTLHGGPGTDTLIGGAGNDTFYGHGGGDTFIGGVDNDTYIIESLSENVVENAGEGTDSVLAYVSGYTLAPNVEIGYLQIAGTLIGNSADNTLYGSAGNDTLDGGGGNDMLSGWTGIDTLIGGTGNDTFRFTSGESNGDIVVDFAGNGASAGDQFQFIGYGTAAAGATFVQIDATHWQINSADGLIHDIITIQNGASIYPTDYIFI